MKTRLAGTWWGRLIQVHRYLGILFCGLFLAWFGSGLVMLFKRMPSLTTTERLDGLALLRPDLVTATPWDAWARLGESSAPLRVRLAMLGPRPVYRFLLPNGAWVAGYGDTGEPVGQVSRAQAAQAAEPLSPGPGARLRYDTRLAEPDQWTLSSAIRRLGPLQRFSFDDAGTTTVYVTEATGEAVMKTDRSARSWGYVGAVLHWMYFTPLRRHTKLWAALVTYGSLLGALLCLSGIVIGFTRFSPRRGHAGNRASPYRGWHYWHHWAGLSFGLLTFTWVLSGALSMTPWDWSPGNTPSQSIRDGVGGGPIDLRGFRLSLADGIGAIRRRFRPKEVEFIQFAGRPYYLAYSDTTPVGKPEWENTEEGGYLDPGASSATVMVPADGRKVELIEAFSREELGAAAARAIPDARVVESTWLDDYDAYYYHASRGLQLPVLRVKFNDRNRSWIYLAPKTGTVVQHEVVRSRVERWVYRGLHDLDFPGLYQRRPAWTLVMIAGLLGGLALSLTAVRIGFRRLGALAVGLRARR